MLLFGSCSDIYFALLATLTSLSKTMALFRNLYTRALWVLPSEFYAEFGLTGTGIVVSPKLPIYPNTTTKLECNLRKRTFSDITGGVGTHLSCLSYF